MQRMMAYRSFAIAGIPAAATTPVDLRRSGRALPQTSRIRCIS